MPGPKPLLASPVMAKQVRPCHLDCGRVTVFRPSELTAAKDQGACTRDFLLRIIDEVENRARTLTNLQRRQVAQALREVV